MITMIRIYSFQFSCKLSLLPYIAFAALINLYPVNASVAQDDLVRASQVPATIQVGDQDKTTADTSKSTKYEFTLTHGVDFTEVKSQGSTGTCWSFATASFIESELLRMGKGEHDISEMQIVYNIYREKARNYILRQGKANFSEGALAHDFINAAARHGLIPESIFSGRESDDQRHNHGEMVALLEGMLNGIVNRSQLTPQWESAFERVLQTYLGEIPDRFSYRGQSYSPQEFADSLGFRAEDYLNLTSFNHHPFYKQFVLEIPDNFSNGRFYNLPVDEMMNVIDHALSNGFSVAWDGDVSEPGFSQGYGLAILPTDPNRQDRFQNVGPEMSVDQDLRQQGFFSKQTTDDHLMHITGIAQDSLGNKYYVIKNSWGAMGPHQGILYASEAYLRMKTVSVLLHRDGLPARLRDIRH